ncbi:MAG: flagellar basal body-associated FliL family protein [Alphaproteobacteria bacterium]|nr:flagellar basal body-associated FliL family protein [Alphaproteobacteria bacterium]
MADAKSDKENEAEILEGAAAADGAEGEEGAEGGEAKGKSKKKLILFIAAPVLLLAVAGAGLYFTGMLGGGDKAAEEGGEHGEDSGDGHGAKAEKADDGHGGGGGGHGEAKSGNFIEIPPMIVNLNTDDDTPRYLRLTVQLELEKSSDRAAVEAIIPRVIDQFQSYLRELRVKDLRGSAGIYRLQMEMLWRVNQAAAPVKVKDVLLQEILIQ